MATAKKTTPRKPDEVAELRARLAKRLGVSEKDAELRALRELAQSLEAEPKRQPASAIAAAPSASYLPQRLYLVLDGRGMPVEVIDLPCTIGSERKCTVWVNSPRIETQHLQITHSREGWILEDLGSEHGTFLGDRKIKRRVVADGDEYRLAGYLRLRTELR
jgi:hypothetical protein